MKEIHFVCFRYLKHAKCFFIDFSEQEWSGQAILLLDVTLSVRGRSQTTFTAMGEGGLAKCQLYLISPIK